MTAMLKQCPRCRLLLEIDAAACCRNCGTELVLPAKPTPAPGDSAPREVLEDAPTRKRPSPTRS